MPAPDFICIGAQKAGTSWLWNNLACHPKVRFADPAQVISPKEVNYFDPKLRSACKAGVLETDEWYLSLFQPDNGQISGEASPSYAPLNGTQIEHVHRVAPAAKILYLLRNPIERQWSGWRMRMTAQRPADEKVFGEWLVGLRFAASTHSHYMHHIKRWQKQFGDQLAAFFFEALQESPGNFYTDICRFLDIDPALRSSKTSLDEPVFVGPEMPCPDFVRRDLAEVFAPTIEACDRMFRNQYTANWMESLAAARALQPNPIIYLPEYSRSAEP